MPPTFEQTHTGTPTPAGGGVATSRLNRGVGQGVNGFLIAVESINDTVYIGFAPSVEHPSQVPRPN